MLRNETKSKVGLAVVAALAAGTLCGGCKEVPRGERGGRIDPYQVTGAEKSSEQVPLAMLLEFCDQVAESLARDLAEIDEVENSPTKVVLELGSVDNKTRTPTGDFVQIRNRLRGKLFSSRMIRDRFNIVESRSRMDRELERISGPPPQDLLEEGNQRQGTADYDPNLVYVLQGDFFESSRGTRQQFYFEFKLTNLASRQIAFTDSYDLGRKF